MPLDGEKQYINPWTGRDMNLEAGINTFYSLWFYSIHSGLGISFTGVVAERYSELAQALEVLELAFRKAHNCFIKSSDSKFKLRSKIVSSSLNSAFSG